MPAGQPRAPGDDRHVLMRIENTFDVPASADESWRLLNDVPAMVTCMPGAELVKVVGDDAWQAKLHVKLGPIALQFIADVTRVQVDEARHRAVLAVKAREAKGRGSAEATIESSLAPADEGTRVALSLANTIPDGAKVHPATPPGAPAPVPAAPAAPAAPVNPPAATSPSQPPAATGTQQR